MRARGPASFGLGIAYEREGLLNQAVAAIEGGYLQREVAVLRDVRVIVESPGPACASIESACGAVVFARPWQFLLRTALPVRAPSIVS